MAATKQSIGVEMKTTFLSSILILGLLAGTPSATTAEQGPCYNVIIKRNELARSVTVESAVAAFTRNRANAAAVVSSIIKPAEYLNSSSVLKRLNPIEEEAGKGNAGVFRVELTETGQRVALKAASIHDYYLKGNRFTGDNLNQSLFVENMIIQKTLGDLGFAPTVHGVLSRQELIKFVKEVYDAQGLVIDLSEKGFVSDVEAGQPFFGIVMDEVVNAWNFAKSKRSFPALATWESQKVADILSRIHEFEAALNAMGIFAIDPQFFIDEAGRVVLGDLGYFRLAKTPYEKNRFTDEMVALVIKYEKQSGRTFPNELFLSVTGRQRR